MATTLHASTIQITQEGREAVNDFSPNIKKHVLEILRDSCGRALTLCEVISEIRAEHHEYKRVEVGIFARHIAELIKLHYLVFNNKEY